MDVFEAILSRRSTRAFKKDPIQKELILKIMEAGMRAPSAGNQQAWHFIVVEDREILDTIPTISPNAKMCETASAAIIVCGDSKLEKHEGMWVQDCSAAAENILLAAHALGLGAVWTALFPRNDRVKNAKKLFSMPENAIPLCIIPIGWPAEKQEPIKTFNPDRVYLNCWGDKY